MPSHPIATWITPCNSRKVQVLGTSTRRHTIGLIPSSQTLTCTISAASASAADEAVSTTGLARFGARVPRPAYRRSPLAVAGTPDILMLSNRLEQDHRGLKGRYRPMRGFKCPRSAARFCRGHDELRNFLRPRSRPHQHAPADRRRLHLLRRTVAVLGILEAA